jgi:hypothetical protein
MVTGAELAKQARQITVVSGERQSSVEHLIAADRPTQFLDRLIANLDPGRLHIRLGGDRHRNQATVLTVSTGHLDQRLVIGACDQIELASSQALAAFRALKAAGLPAENIQNVHERFLPRRRPLEPRKLIAPAHPKGLTAESE